MGREVLRGRVQTGLGDLARWMTAYADIYERRTGVRLHPGSLNVALDDPWVLEDPPIRLEPDEVGVGVGIVPCTIASVPAFVVRTDRNNAGEGAHAPTIVEIAAAVHLRSTLGLADGDEVEIEIDGGTRATSSRGCTPGSGVGEQDPELRPELGQTDGARDGL